MDKIERFQALYPEKFFLDSSKQNALTDFLHDKGWLAKGESIIQTEKPGEGNMNFVLRIITAERSFILKQSRPWVEKYPQIDAPIERIGVEASFYQVLQDIPEMSSYTADILDFDEDNFLMAIEDLGPGADFTYLYQKGNTLQGDGIKALMVFLSTLHQIENLPPFPDNMEMRKLNHEHIFNYPYLSNNGFDLNTVQQGLEEAASPIRQDQLLLEKIRTLGERYLSPGDTLLHGDYYPGSWLKVSEGIRVIDPEFAFVGPAEFDLGVLLAHNLMAEQSIESMQTIWDLYEPKHKINKEVLSAYTGIEILRRLIGLAQLPLDLSLLEKQNLMQKAAQFISTGDIDFLSI